MANAIFPISFREVQSIQGVVGSGELQPASLCPPKGVRLKGVSTTRLQGCCYAPWGGPSGISVPSGFKTSCAGDVVVVTRKIECLPKVSVDEAQVETVARGVAEGMRVAPILSVQPAPWVAPNYRGRRDPHTAAVVLSTFATTDVRVVWAQNALASYLTTTNFTVNAVQVTAGATAQVLSFQPSDDWTGDSFEVACQDLEFLYLTQWAVAVNGQIRTGPFSLVEGRAPINLQVRRGEVVSVVAVVASTDSFAVGLIPILNGWLHPSLTQTDGTYTKTLRASPSWPGGGRRS